MNILIIGNSAAGVNTAASIRNNSNHEITMISKEKVPGYFRPTLSNYLGEETLNERFFIKKEDWYIENNINVTLAEEVISILPEEKKVILKNGDSLYYDKLILANGSKNLIPPIPNINIKNVFSLKTLEDAEEIKTSMKMSKNVVIIGGGLLGLEAAWAMKSVGQNVTVIEKFPRILPRQLDTDCSLIFKNKIIEESVNLILGKGISKILGEDEITGVLLDDGDIIPCDILLVSIGIVPNIDLLKGTGINTNRGVIVNNKMETNIKDIYACGDIAEFGGKIYGNWTAAMEMGKVAGLNALNIDTEFKDMVLSSIFNGMNTSLFSCGDVCSDYYEEIIDRSDEESGIARRIFINKGKIVGGILVGDTKLGVKILNGVKNEKSKEDMIKILEAAI